MQRFVYSFCIELYWFVGNVVGLFNNKAKKWSNGHRRLTPKNLPEKKNKRVWFHISSLGEYEQARPIIKGLIDDFEIVITFFSPSGYEAKNVREFTNNVFYLGKDTKSRGLKSIKTIQPDYFVLVKYDFWLNHLIELKNAQVNTILISGLFRSNQVFFKCYGGIFKNAIKGIKHLFLQNEKSAKLLKSIGIENTTVNGDTRVDSVLENVPIALNTLPNTVKDFTKGNKCLVVGSSYLAEEQIIADNLSGCLKDWKIIIAPHNIKEKDLNQIETLFGINATFLSKSRDGTSTPNTQVLVVDQIGLLKYLYAIADVAFVGGGFGKTVHNTLEPAAFGIPILFGPNFSKFPEAVALVTKGGAFQLETKHSFQKKFTELQDSISYQKASSSVNHFINGNKETKKAILKYFLN